MSPPSGAAAGVASLMSATAASVVRSVAEMLTALASAFLVTLTGSMIPSLIMST